jgi:ABC-type branched-subunit amino acid transport system ATPase component
VSLVIEALRAGYGELEILQGASLRVAPGQIVGLIGPNGAGKSTLLKTIFGYLRPTAGRVELDGHDLVGRRPDQILTLGISYLAQTGGLFPDMTVHENLGLGGFSLDGARQRREALDEVYARFPLLTERRRQMAGSLSGGEQRILAVARALMVRPRLMLLDEPTAALAPRFIDRVYETIVALNRSGIALLVAEQNVELILAAAQRIFVLDLGQNAFDGTPAELRESARLRRLYLGEA